MNAERALRALDPYIVSGPDASGDYRAHCPMPDHDDGKPSAGINLEKNTWHCMGCGRSGTVKSLLRFLKDEGPPPNNVTSLEAERMKRRPADAKPTLPLPNVAQIEGWHERLLGNSKVIEYLTDKRGIDVPTLQQFKIGWNGKRIIIPVYDVDDQLVNVRQYLMNARDDQQKMINWRGHGKARLFAAKILPKVERVILCEGEWDAIITMQHGFPAVCGTGGAKTFSPEWAKAFAGKKVYIIYDCDDDGRAGAAKAAQYIHPVAAEVFVISLPLDKKGADLSDYFSHYGHNADDLNALLRAAEASPYVPPGRTRPVQGTAQRVPLSASYDARYSGQPLDLVAQVIGKKNPPYQVPQELEATCDRNWTSSKACPHCPMQAKNGHDTAKVASNDPGILRLIDVPEAKQLAIIKENLGIPPKCPRVEIEAKAKQNIERLVIAPSIDSLDDTDPNDTRMIYSVGRPDTPTNAGIRVTGTNCEDPRNQLNAFLAWEVEQTESDIDTFSVNKETREMLKVFQLAKGQQPIEKLHEIAADLADNVTGIYGRPGLHAAIDLVYHSILQFRFNGALLDKGWLELLVLGDTRTGKSLAAEKMSRFYRAGRMTNCESATLAGLLGAVKQYGSGKEWQLTWGLIPLNNRRLVILDETSGLSAGVIGQLSSVRSSGIAEINKVESAMTQARTRLIWISNPVDGGNLSAYPEGVQAIQPLIGNNEDIARFDLAMGCTVDEVDPDEIRRLKRKKVPHRHTAQASHALVMWCWSRKPEQVVWAKGAEDEVIRQAEWLGRHYDATPPLLQSSNAHVKVARLAVALAARLYSTDRTGQNVVVKKEHVRDAVRFLDDLYSKPAFGYRAMSEYTIAKRERARDNRKAVKKYLRGRAELANFLYRTAMEDRGRFRQEDILGHGAVDRDDANVLMGELFKWEMLRKVGPVTQIDPIMVDVLKELRAEGRERA